MVCRGGAHRRSRAVVVEDRTDSLRVRDQGIPARKAQVDEESLVRFPLAVAEDDDGDRLTGLTRSERDRPTRGPVVVVRGLRRAVGGGVVDRYGLVVACRQADGEDEQRGAAVAFWLG